MYRSCSCLYLQDVTCVYLISHAIFHALQDQETYIYIGAECRDTDSKGTNQPRLVLFPQTHQPKPLLSQPPSACQAKISENGIISQ